MNTKFTKWAEQKVIWILGNSPTTIDLVLRKAIVDAMWESYSHGLRDEEERQIVIHAHQMSQENNAFPFIPLEDKTAEDMNIRERFAMEIGVALCTKPTLTVTQWAEGCVHNADALIAALKDKS